VISSIVEPLAFSRVLTPPGIKLALALTSSKIVTRDLFFSLTIFME
jgi:hypothetical protein